MLNDMLQQNATQSMQWEVENSSVLASSALVAHSSPTSEIRGESEVAEYCNAKSKQGLSSVLFPFTH